MCPLSALSQLFVLLFLLLVCGTALAQSLVLYLQPKDVVIQMYNKAVINYTVEGTFDPGDCLEIKSDDPNIAQVDRKIYITNPTGSFDILGNFLGTSNVTVEVKPRCSNTAVLRESTRVKVVRKERAIDKVFTASVAILVSIIYINFGCALKWNDLKSLLKRPIGPAIGFIGQFVLMPLLSFVIGYALFPNNPTMRLGIFFTGCAPAGGGSNIWTALLDGNIDLSITMTTISTFAAFAMIPFWTFTLGAVIFNEGNIEIPYGNISTYALGLVIPLFIGFLLQRYTTKTSEFLRRTLKAFSGCLIVFIIIFAIVTNLYLFKLFSWRIIVSGMGLPWLGYLAGWLLAKMFNQPPKDCLAIAIEVGLQNTGIAIFLLRFTLPQPEADLTTIAPVSVAIMTPFPLFILFLIQLARKRKQEHKDKKKYVLSCGITTDDTDMDTSAQEKLKEIPIIAS